MDRLRAGILIAHARLERERLRLRIERLERKTHMARDLASLEQALGLFEGDMDKEAEKVFDHMDTVRVKAGDVFKRTHARVDASAATVDRVDKLVTSLDRANTAPTSGGSSKDSGNSSGASTPPPPPPPPPAPPPSNSAEKKTA